MSAAAPAKAKPLRKRKRWPVVLLALLAVLLYLLIGALAPFAVHPTVSEDFQSAFDLSSFYGGGSVDRAVLVEDNVDALDLRIRMINESRERIVFANFARAAGTSPRPCCPRRGGAWTFKFSPMA